MKVLERKRLFGHGTVKREKAYKGLREKLAPIFLNRIGSIIFGCTDLIFPLFAAKGTELRNGNANYLREVFSRDKEFADFHLYDQVIAMRNSYRDELG